LIVQEANADTIGTVHSLAATGGIVTLTDAAAPSVAGHLGMFVTVTDTVNSLNTGRFQITLTIDAVVPDAPAIRGATGRDDLLVQLSRRQPLHQRLGVRPHRRRERREKRLRVRFLFKCAGGQKERTSRSGR
jgi:hypothetical protein